MKRIKLGCNRADLLGFRNLRPAAPRKHRGLYTFDLRLRKRSTGIVNYHRHTKNNKMMENLQKSLCLKLLNLLLEQGRGF